jgi:hypothetical protein
MSNDNGHGKCPNCGAYKRSRLAPKVVTVAVVLLVIGVLALVPAYIISVNAPANEAAAQQNGLTYVGDQIQAVWLMSGLLLVIVGGVTMYAGLQRGPLHCANCGYDLVIRTPQERLPFSSTVWYAYRNWSQSGDVSACDDFIQALRSESKRLPRGVTKTAIREAFPAAAGNPEFESLLSSLPML